MRKEIIDIVLPYCEWKGIESAESIADEILALEPFAKLERVREYCEKNEGTEIENILNILSENEKAE